MRKEFDVVKTTGFYQSEAGEKKRYGNLGRLTLHSKDGEIPSDIKVFLELTSEMIPLPDFSNPVQVFEKRPRT